MLDDIVQMPYSISFLSQARQSRGRWIWPLDYHPPLPLKLLDTPDFLVLPLVIILRVIHILLATIKGDIVLGDQMGWRNIARWFFLGKGPVGFIHNLPAVQF